MAEISKDGRCAIPTPNRSEALKALSFQILWNIGLRVAELASQSDANSLRVVGAGDEAFRAGTDVTELRNRRLIALKRWAEFELSVFARLGTRAASIALINPYAFGGRREWVPAIKLALGRAQRLPLRLAQGLWFEADLSALAYRTGHVEEGTAALEPKRKSDSNNA